MSRSSARVKAGTDGPTSEREGRTVWGRMRARFLVTSAIGEVCYEPPSSLRTTSHTEREMRELNRRADGGARWSIRGVRNLLRLRLARRCNPDDYARIWSNHDSSVTVEARSPDASISTR